MDTKNQIPVRTGGSLSWEERKAMISAYLTGQYSKSELWRNYTGQQEEHGQLLNWMRKLGYTTADMSIKHRKTSPHPASKQNESLGNTSSEQAAIQALQKRAQQLEKALEVAHLRIEGYEEMIQIAEQAFKIPIRKKYAAR